MRKKNLYLSAIRTWTLPSVPARSFRGSKAPVELASAKPFGRRRLGRGTGPKTPCGDREKSAVGLARKGTDFIGVDAGARPPSLHGLAEEGTNPRGPDASGSAIPMTVIAALGLSTEARPEPSRSNSSAKAVLWVFSRTSQAAIRGPMRFPWNSGFSFVLLACWSSASSWTPWTGSDRTRLSNRGKRGVLTLPCSTGLSVATLPNA